MSTNKEQALITQNEIAKNLFEQGYPLTVISERTKLALDQIVEFQYLEGWQRRDNVPPEVRAELEQIYCETAPAIAKHYQDIQNNWFKRAKEFKGDEDDANFATAIEKAAKAFAILTRSMQAVTLKDGELIHLSEFKAPTWFEEETKKEGAPG